MHTFLDKFQFNPANVLNVGIERECFLADHNGLIVPIASKVLRHLNDSESFGYELSACQLEERIGPCHVDQAAVMLNKNRLKLEMVGWLMNFKRLHTEVGPENMPLDVYPDPSGRYQEIVKTMPRHILLAACRVIGTHIHIGMPDHETALRVYNYVIKKCDWLCARGNGSFGERLDIYRVVAPDCDPQPYADWADFYRVALAKGFDQDPRKCWTLIRISKHGTIEFRMFGATASLERIVGWAKLCHDLCKEAMA